ncbi:MAG: hypothetical protein IT349_06295 [Candidatus Eisenbacteria bacterium]|nr:hypothetical protein [Candidatus Eisenbacteria bacterium]MCC7141698.1 hypothetical protein [Candidatus Eisenbacteria bacterium]
MHAPRTESNAHDLSRARLARLALLLAVAALVAGVPALPGRTRLLVALGFAGLSGLALVAGEAEARLRRRGLGWIALLCDLAAYAHVVIAMSAAGRPFLLLLALPVLIWGVLRGLSGALAAAAGAMIVALGLGGDAGLTAPLARETVAAIVAFLFLGLCSGVLGQRIQSAERAHRDTRRALLETTLDAESIVSCLSTGLLCLDPKGQVRRRNDNAERLLLAAGEIELGIDLEQLAARPGLEALGAHLSACLGSTFETTREFEAEEWCGGFPLEVATAPLRGPGGETRGLIVVLADLSERRARETERKRSEKLALIGQLSAGLAHEMRNSLKPITGSLELLRDDSWSGSGARPPDPRLIEIVLREADRLEGFLSEFLSFARDKSLTVEAVSLESVLREEGATLESLLSLPLTRGPCPDGQPLIRADRAALGQVLKNLALNAEQAGEVMTIELSAHVEGAEAWIEVRDDGAGIPEGVMEHVFEPFFTTKPRGTGLGLAIARDLVDRMGGELTLAPAPGNGTVAIIRLPLLAPAAQAA